MKVIDVSGESNFRNLWEDFAKPADGLVFVIDSSDSLRLNLAFHELEILLTSNTISKRKLPILIFANK